MSLKSNNNRQSKVGIGYMSMNDDKRQNVQVEASRLGANIFNSSRTTHGGFEPSIISVSVYLVVNAVLAYGVYRALGMTVFWSITLTSVIFGLISNVTVNTCNFIIRHNQRHKLIAESMMAEKNASREHRKNNPWDLEA